MSSNIYLYIIQNNTTYKIEPISKIKPPTPIPSPPHTPPITPPSSPTLKRKFQGNYFL